MCVPPTFAAAVAAIIERESIDLKNENWKLNFKSGPKGGRLDNIIIEFPIFSSTQKIKVQFCCFLFLN
jgi:hypothetical protein